MKTYTLYELNEWAMRVIALNFAEPLWLSAEIGQVNTSRGHCYMELVEKNDKEILAQLSAVAWQGSLKSWEKKWGVATLKSLLTLGRVLKMKGRLDFHERYGLKFIIEEIDLEHTIGNLEMQRQRTLEVLKSEQLLDKNKQQPIPLVVQRLAVISSATAAGFIDFQTHLAENPLGYRYSLHLFAAAMQGVNLEKEIVEQLNNIAEKKDLYDAVCIMRGGGSKLDLAGFDSEVVCRAGAHFPLPVFVSIGHEIDVSIMDLLAAHSAKTPTALADSLLSHNQAFETKLLDYHQEITQKAQQLLQNANYSIEKTTYQLQQLSRQQIQTEKQALQNMATVLQLLGIEATLQRGYTITLLENGATLKGALPSKDTIIHTKTSMGDFKSVVE